MKWKQGSQQWRLAWAGLVLLALLGGASVTRADEPMLAIRLAGGESAVYAVSQVERMGFEGDALVIVSASGTVSYATEAITRIEFLWDFSGIHDPREAAAVLKVAHLFQNQPNPFSPETCIAFDLPQAGPVELQIYSVNGRLVRRLVAEERAAGHHVVRWDGRSDAGKASPSGVYFYKLTAPGVEESRQMILVP